MELSSSSSAVAASPRAAAILAISQAAVVGDQLVDERTQVEIAGFVDEVDRGGRRVGQHPALGGVGIRGDEAGDGDETVEDGERRQGEQ